MVDKIMTMEERTKIQVLSPIINGRKGEHIKTIENIIKSGYVRARIDGNIVDLEEEEIKLEKIKTYHRGCSR